MVIFALKEEGKRNSKCYVLSYWQYSVNGKLIIVFIFKLYFFVIFISVDKGREGGGKLKS